MAYQVFSLAQLESAPVAGEIFLEYVALKPLLTWIGAPLEESERSARREAMGRLDLMVFGYQLRDLPEPKRRLAREKLRELSIRVETGNWPSDRLAAQEIANLCFVGDAQSLERARFLLAARHHSDGHEIRLVTTSKSYARLPHVECFLI